MTKQLLAKNIPADEIDDVEEAFKALGATELKKDKQPNGTYNLEGTFPD
ncbi:hypothetical protein [Bradyrhizobium sp. Y36]|nr:hypothetical protein [Bradyrhizobium sp. Y36]